MKTKEQLKIEFLAELSALLKKYGAEITAEDHWMGYAECGADVRMTASIPGCYNKETGDVINEWTEIDLGNYINGKL